MAAELHDLFPTPVMRVPGAVAADAAHSLADRLAAAMTVGNDRSGELTHSRLFAPGDDAAIDGIVQGLGPHVQALGEQMFGERMPWLVKEIWANVLQAGGHQSLHNHANCFVSGIVYLSPCDESARTVFVRGMGAGEFVFRNTNAATSAGPYSAQKWIAPMPQAGDLLLFPSWLLHEVPRNTGSRRVTLAFNAIPRRLDAWGYGVSFQP